MGGEKKREYGSLFSFLPVRHHPLLGSTLNGRGAGGRLREGGGGATGGAYFLANR